MSSYYTPSRGVVNRYWKRPKPKVYDCNVRDAERFYQQNYKDYLEAKEYSAQRAAEDRSRISDDSATRYGFRRTNSVTESASRDIPSYDSTSRSSYLNANSSRQYGDDSLSSSFRSTSISGNRNTTPDSEMTSIEDRLQRLQKLRAELGLPSSETSTGTSKVKFSVPSPTGSTLNLSKRNLRPSPDPRERRGKTVDVSSSSSYSAARGGSRTKAVNFASDTYGDSNSSSGNERSSKFSTKYSYDDTSDTKPKQNGINSERSSRYSSKYSYDDTSDSKPKQNGYASSNAKDESDNYSYKGSLKSSKKYDADDDSYSYKPRKSKDAGDSDTFKSRRKVTTVEDNDIGDYDDDAFLDSIKKKFPTSEEIMERINKMNSDM